MTDWNKKQLQNIRDGALGPEDTFRFTCKTCGQCCRRRESPIIVTGLDVFRLAQKLNISPAEAVESYTEVILGASSHMPITILRERLDGSCVLLRNGRCMVHDHKPVVCAVYPLGRAIDPGNGSIQYFQKKQTCGKEDGRIWTLREWIDEWGLDKLDEECIAWSKMTQDIALFTCKLKKGQVTKQLQNAILDHMVLNYNVSMPYLEQIEENRKKLINILTGKFHLQPVTIKKGIRSWS